LGVSVGKSVGVMVAVRLGAKVGTVTVSGGVGVYTMTLAEVGVAVGEALGVSIVLRTYRLSPPRA
jgi:hypothetical protein